MDNPQELIAPRGGEFYLNEKTGRTHVRLPAGGTGGGVTSFADAPASEEQHVAYLKQLADQKHAEGEVLQQRHEEAGDALQKKKDAEQPPEQAEAADDKPKVEVEKSTT